MLTPFDDYALHQTPAPIAHPASGDRNHYDRYFFNGYDPEGAFFFGGAMGLYPNRGVIDAAFSVVEGTRQRSVFASAPLPADRSATRVGPIAVEIVEPLATTRLVVSAPEHGLEADLTFEACSPVVEEPRQTVVEGTSVLMDATRMTQLGRWRGGLSSADFSVDLAGAPGTKDRSWGVRPVGEPLPGAPIVSAREPGMFFLWTPMQLGDEGYFLALFEHPDGQRWYRSGARTPLIGPGDATWGPGVEVEELHGVDYHIDLRPGTRRSAAARFDYRWPGGDVVSVEFEPVLDFPMRGIGYFHPTWSHGRYHGPEPVSGFDEWDLGKDDPLALDSLHVEQVCRVRAGAREGVGVFEQLVIGPHAPLGLTGLNDAPVS